MLSLKVSHLNLLVLQLYILYSKGSFLAGLNETSWQGDIILALTDETNIITGVWQEQN